MYAKEMEVEIHILFGYVMAHQLRNNSTDFIEQSGDLMLLETCVRSAVLLDYGTSDAKMITRAIEELKEKVGIFIALY